MKRIFFLVICFFTLFSCKIEIQKDNPEFEHKVVVNSFLVVGDTLEVNVSLAEKLDTVPLTFVDNATVDLYVNGEFAEQLIYTSDGTYRSNSVIQSLNEYTCKVNVPGYNEVSCSQLIPQIPSIINIEHINIAGKDEEGTSYPAMKITFANDPVIEKFYDVEIRTIRRFRDELNIGIVDIHTIVDPVILNEGTEIALFSNELIEDSSYTLMLNYTTHGASSSGGAWRTDIYPFVVELRQVTEDYYRHKKQLYLYDEGLYADGIITSMTSTALFSNVDNGYGIFAGYAATVSDTIYPNLDGYYD